MTILEHLAARRRPIWQALAHVMVAAKPGHSDRMVRLNRLFQSLSFQDQQKCRLELAECRAARRAGLMRGVA